MEVVPTKLAYTANEILICWTAGGVMPITTLESHAVKDNKVGIITKTIWDRYWSLHYEEPDSFDIKYES